MRYKAGTTLLDMHIAIRMPACSSGVTGKANVICAQLGPLGIRLPGHPGPVSHRTDNACLPRCVQVGAVMARSQAHLFQA